MGTTSGRKKKQPRARRRARAATPPPPQTPPPPALKLSPEESLQELALVMHRLNDNLLAVAKLSGARLQVEQQRLLVAKRLLRVQRRLLDITEEARREADALKAASSDAQGLSLRLLDTVLQRFAGAAAGQPTTTAEPPQGTATAELPNVAERPAPRGVVVRGANGARPAGDSALCR